MTSLGMELELDGAWLADKLQAAGFSDDTLHEYIMGILADTTTDDEEKAEAIGDFLSELAGKPMDELVAEVMGEVERARQRAEERARQRHEAALAAAAEEEKRVLEALQAAHLADNDGGAGASSDGFVRVGEGISKPGSLPQLTLAERKQREALLIKYAYDDEELVETEDGKMEVHSKGRAGPARDATGLLVENRNAKMVAEREQAQRAQAREDHAKQQARIKEQQERERLKREKERKRTQRRERQRG